MPADLEDPATLVAGALSKRPREARSAFLRELLAHTAAGLALLDGDRNASEVIYRLADAVVSCGED